MCEYMTAEDLNMDKYIFNEDNGLWYELTGDYYLPCVTAPTEEKQAVGSMGAAAQTVSQRVPSRIILMLCC